jgi:hypothetical protein
MKVIFTIVVLISSGRSGGTYESKLWYSNHRQCREAVRKMENSYQNNWEDRRHVSYHCVAMLRGEE